MRTVLILMLIAGIGGFLAFHKYSERRYSDLRMQLEKAHEKNEELLKKIRLLEQKLQLESLDDAEIKRPVPVKTPAGDDRAAAQRENERKIAEKQKELDKLKAELELVSAKRSLPKIDVDVISRKMEIIKSKINQRHRDLAHISQLLKNHLFVCYDMCINSTDVTFERKMTRTCRSTVSGGIYFCDHYDMTKTDFCTRHLKHHRNWNFPNRYRDDHISKVNYLCRAHKNVWTAEMAAEYNSKYRNSRAVLANQVKYRNEISQLSRELGRLENERQAAVRKNAQIEKANQRNLKAAEEKRAALQKKIDVLEKELEELEK